MTPTDTDVPVSESWREENDLGLSLARDGRWSDASDAFSRALAMAGHASQIGLLAERDISAVQSVLYTNLAQAAFHRRQFAEARRYAEECCALRIAALGEDAPSVARARSDLAVILGASGALGEAQSLVRLAIDSVEKNLGDEDLALVPLLENAARLALIVQQPALAEPHLLRLHALLHAHNQPTDSAERLLKRVAEARASARERTPIAHVSHVAHVAHEPTPTPDHSFHAGPLSNSGDDVLLRDAIAVTSDLLRTTPTSNIAQPDPSATLHRDVERTPEVVHAFPDVAPVDESVSLFDSLELPTVETTSQQAAHDLDELLLTPHSGIPESNGVIDVLDLEMALDGALLSTIPPTPLNSTPRQASSTPKDAVLDDVAFDLVEPPPPTLNVVPKPKEASPGNTNPLGFAVEYGILPQQHEPLGGGPEPLPVNPVTPTSAPVFRRASDWNMPVVMPAPGAPAPRRRHEDQIEDDADLNNDPPRLSVHTPSGGNAVARDSAAPNAPNRPRFGRTQVAEPSRMWIVASLLAVAAASAALWYYVTQVN